MWDRDSYLLPIVKIFLKGRRPKISQFVLQCPKKQKQKTERGSLMQLACLSRAWLAAGAGGLTASSGSAPCRPLEKAASLVLRIPRLAHRSFPCVLCASVRCPNTAPSVLGTSCSVHPPRQRTMPCRL